MKIKNCKTRGEWTELVFMQRAIEHGLRFGKPWGEPKGYDFAVERGGKFVSVQVKSTMCRKPEGGYSCCLKDSKGKYRGNPFEFLAAYVIPDDTWFIVPGRKVRGMSNIALYPHSNRAKYTPYKEAWHLLRGSNSTPERIDIMACVDEAYSTEAEVLPFDSPKETQEKIRRDAIVVSTLDSAPSKLRLDGEVIRLARRPLQAA